MNMFHRVLAGLLWLLLLLFVCFVAIVPLRVVAWSYSQLGGLLAWLTTLQEANATNFLIAQIAIGIGAVLIFGTLIWLEWRPRRPKGVRIRTTEGSAELDPSSVSRRLEWHLDQLADVITVIPSVRARGDVVDINLEIETAPEIDVAMKTDEVVEVTRDIVEQDMGLKLGKLDVRMRHAPFEPEWAA